MDAETNAPCDTDNTFPAANGTNGTNTCASESGAFFLEGDVVDTNTVFNSLIYSYELETRGDPAAVLPSLEISFVDALLPVLFPFHCGDETSLNPFVVGVAGITSDPPDEILEGGEPPIECECFVKGAILRLKCSRSLAQGNV
jgi:hypothetical protein